MARRQILVQVSDSLLAALDERAAATGTSRSELIRVAVERELREGIEAAIDEAILAGYARHPPDRDDWWAEWSGRRSVEAEPW